MVCWFADVERNLMCDAVQLRNTLQGKNLVADACHQNPQRAFRLARPFVFLGCQTDRIDEHVVFLPQIEIVLALSLPSVNTSMTFLSRFASSFR